MLGRVEADGCFVVLLVLAGLIAVPAILVSYFRGLRRFEETCGRVAERLGGVCRGGGWSEPEISFDLEGRRALLTFFGGSKHASPYTRVTVNLAGSSPGTFKLAPHGFGDTLAKLFGAQDLEIGDPVFDRAYVIKANPPSLAGEIFRPDRRREVIRSVASLAEHGHPLVEITGSSLSVQTGAKLTDEACILDIVKRAGDFLGCVVGAPLGIEWVEGTSTSPGRCQVCGSELTERVVRCVKCRTPHHRECWEYAGECSTFACRERRFG